MIKNYAVFYRHMKKNDVLIVTFCDGNKADSYVRDGNFGVVLSKGKPIAYNFFNINKIMKIHAQNMIYYPNSALIDVLNSLIGKKYEHLDYKNNSGYKIACVESMRLIPEKKKFIYYVKTGPRELSVVELDNFQLNPGDVFVMSVPGTILSNGKKCNLHHVCTGNELGFVDMPEIYKMDDSSLIGSDFFQTEENWIC